MIVRGHGLQPELSKELALRRCVGPSFRSLCMQGWCCEWNQNEEATARQLQLQHRYDAHDFVWKKDMVA